jgi:DNA-binding XRE family transcriptional regulator
MGASFLSPRRQTIVSRTIVQNRINIRLQVQSRRSRPPKPTAEECFGLALRESRKVSGLTQERLAFESGYHPTYVGQLERGKKSPSLRVIMALAAVLSTRGSELIRRVESLMEEG